MSTEIAFGDRIDWGLEADRACKEDNVNDNLFYTEYPDIEKIIVHKEKGKLIDCGCNIGKFIEVFENAGYEYTGIDQSEHALNIARSYHPKGNFIHSFLWDVKSKYKFDIAFFHNVLQHNTHGEKLKILMGISKILKKNSIIVMSESTVPKETVTQLTNEGWITLVENLGFELLENWHENEFGLKDNYIFKKI